MMVFWWYYQFVSTNYCKKRVVVSRIRKKWTRQSCEELSWSQHLATTESSVWRDWGPSASPVGRSCCWYRSPPVSCPATWQWSRHWELWWSRYRILWEYPWYQLQLRQWLADLEEARTKNKRDLVSPLDGTMGPWCIVPSQSNTKTPIIWYLEFD